MPGSRGCSWRKANNTLLIQMTSKQPKLSENAFTAISIAGPENLVDCWCEGPPQTLPLVFICVCFRTTQAMQRKVLLSVLSCSSTWSNSMRKHHLISQKWPDVMMNLKEDGHSLFFLTHWCSVMHLAGMQHYSATEKSSRLLRNRRPVWAGRNKMPKYESACAVWFWHFSDHALQQFLVVYKDKYKEIVKYAFYCSFTKGSIKCFNFCFLLMSRALRTFYFFNYVWKLHVCHSLPVHKRKLHMKLTMHMKCVSSMCPYDGIISLLLDACFLWTVKV